METLETIERESVNREPVTGAVSARPAGAGRLVGKRVAESMEPTVEYAYWRDNFTKQAYVAEGAKFDDYGPAYVFGIHSSAKYGGRTFDELEPDMARDWDTVRGTSNLTWDSARDASRDAWERSRLQR